MSNTWICSDWHFNHDKPFIWKERGFNSVFEMNNEIIKRHNSLVNQDDLVICLGDVCMGGDAYAKDNKKLIQSLKGKLIIIQGNHDTENRMKMYAGCYNVQEVVSAKYFSYHKYHFFLSHYPTITSNYDENFSLKKKRLNICGHSHTKDRWSDVSLGLIYHAEMDAHDCYPVNIETIIQDFKERFV